MRCVWSGARKVGGVAESADRAREMDGKAERRAARDLVAAFHREQLRALLGHVRRGFEQLDDGVIDEFELDELIHRYKKAASKLWAFCGAGGGRQVDAAHAITYMRERGQEPPDWWNDAAPPRRG